MTPSDARYTKRYTEAQITALVEAVVDDGLSVAEAERRAQAGTLKAGMEPYGVGKKRFANGLVTKHREAYEEAREDRDTAKLHDNALAEAKRRYRLAARKSRALNDDSDVAEIERVGKAHVAAYRQYTSLLTKETRTTKPQASTREPENHGTEPQTNDTTLAELDAIASSVTARRNTPTDVGENARGPVRSLAH